MRHLVLLCLSLSAFSARAATIDVRSVDGNPIVSISGELQATDGQAFLDKTGTLSTTTVVFNSTGGSLLAAFQIGEAIRSKGFATLVPTNQVCASACALAWLAGKKRYLADGARVGFHAAFDRRTHEVVSSGNALVGAYLEKLGLSPEAIVFATSSSPQTIKWLTPSDAKRLGIAIGPASDSASENTVTVLPPPSNGNGATYVVQVTARRNESDAEAAYADLQKQHPVLLGSRTASFQYANAENTGGFYRVTVGPFGSTDSALQFCDDLMADGGRCSVLKR